MISASLNAALSCLASALASSAARICRKVQPSINTTSAWLTSPEVSLFSKQAV